MTRTLFTTCFLVLAAALFAWSEGGRVGMGVILGGLAGGAVASACVGWQWRTALRAPERALKLSVVAFLIYLVAAILGAVSFRYIGSASAGADWVAFMGAYTLTVFVLMTVGAFDVARTLKTPQATSGDGLPEGVEA